MILTSVDFLEILGLEDNVHYYNHSKMYSVNDGNSTSKSSVSNVSVM